MRNRILIVEDELIVAGDIRLTLEDAGYQVMGIARSVNRAMELIDEEIPLLVLLDIYLKGNLTGITLAAELNKRSIPFIFVSANCNREVLDAANITHPFGFIVKPFRGKDLLVNLNIAKYRYEQQVQFKQSVNRSVVASRIAVNKGTENKSPAPDTAATEFEGIISPGPAMQAIFHLIRQVAGTNTSVLILGESGTGKESVATAIYRQSARKHQPFVKVNCAALPQQLIESELFGHEKGAFTGASERKIGKFEKAHGGTIFLDEIGEMPPEMQVKLLRVLQEREIDRIGGDNPIKVDVRIIAATNRNLEQEISQGRFRLDLYYRLHVFPIEMPALRDHPEDIPALSAHFMREFAARLNKPVTRIADATLQQLIHYPWPGNVRELQNVMERAVLLCEGNELTAITLPHAIRQNKTDISGSQNVRSIQEMEREHILQVLSQCNHRISGPRGAAELLRLPPSTLASKMKKLGIFKKHTV